MQGLTNTVKFIVENWSNIVFIFALLFAIYLRVKKFLSMSKEERRDAILSVVKEELLKLMSDAEKEWKDYIKSGDIKKSQVIKVIYEKFPELATFADQDTIIAEITKIIDQIDPTMDELFSNTKKI